MSIKTCRRHLPTVQCAPWCEDGDGHPDEYHREDQKCWSPSEYLTLTADNSATDFDPQIGVMARRHPDEPARVHLHLYDIEIPGSLPSPWNQLDRGLDLTADEAERLAGLLTEAAKLVRSTPPRGG